MPGLKTLRAVIITGDDFGLAEPVNEAIVEAHRLGALTCASLMVGAESASDAVDKARALPSLKVGLHVVLVEGRAVLPPETVPDLVDSGGNFTDHLVKAGIRYFFRPGIRKQLEAEIRAQFQRFRDSRLPLDHANAHNHMHLHPTILRLMVKVGKEFGLKAVRLPNEPPIRSYKASGKGFLSRFVSWIFLYPWLAAMKRILRRAHIRYNDSLFGMRDSGAMSLELALRFIRNLPPGITEMHFHPATRSCARVEAAMPGYAHEAEYRALTSKALLKALEDAGIDRISFSDIAGFRRLGTGQGKRQGVQDRPKI
ncbi:MAG: hopanoid biosynthesis-associated protein HpnK [Acidobacteria bacterium]|nr:hopanoid biosynthesis-associated protein HpnK [Acidobacteriota bacterium]